MNCWLLESMFIYCICTHYLVGAPFALITASIRRGMEVISLWHCWGMEAQVSLTVAFILSAYVGLLFLIFLFTIPHRFSIGFRSGEFAGQSSRCQILLENQISIFKKLKEAWTAPKFVGKRVQWCWFLKNTMNQHQQMTLHPKSSQTVET